MSVIVRSVHHNSVPHITAPCGLVGGDVRPWPMCGEVGNREGGATPERGGGREGQSLPHLPMCLWWVHCHCRIRGRRAKWTAPPTVTRNSVRLRYGRKAPSQLMSFCHPFFNLLLSANARVRAQICV